MTWEIVFVLGVMVAAVALFASERLPADLVALGVMTALLLSGILTPEEGLAGFANEATITVAAMFVIGVGVFRTGAANFIGSHLGRVAKRSMTLTLLALMGVVALLSAFLNNTAAVAVLIPVVIGVARTAEASPSKLLMPLSYASMFGGTCTLIGTSTNILGNAIAVRYGLPRFGMFEFAKLGLVYVAVGTAYMALVGARLIPARRKVANLVDSFGMGEYLTEVILEPHSDSVGKTLREAPLFKEVGIQLLEIVRGGRRVLPTPRTVLRAWDVLRLSCNLEEVAKLKERAGIALTDKRFGAEELDDQEAILVEAVVAPNSLLSGRTLEEARFRDQFGGTVLAIRHRGGLTRGSLGAQPLRAGDALLIAIPRDQLEHLQSHRTFLVVSEQSVTTFRRNRMGLALVILAAVIASATFGLFPIGVSAVTGALLIVLTGCLNPDEAYRAIEWKVIFLLAGLLALGAAMEKTGTARWVATLLVEGVGHLGPTAILSVLFLFTLVLTEVMSNNATVALLMPIAIGVAYSLGVDPRPFLFAVMFAASSSFMTPVGYQTNMMIYAPGQYRFTDFVRVGAPLNLLFWILGTLLIPVLWPF